VLAAKNPLRGVSCGRLNNNGVFGSIGPKECQNAGVGSESIFRENRRSITSVTATCNFLLNLMMTEHREMVKSL
jgi:hypothetical protein